MEVGFKSSMYDLKAMLLINAILSRPVKNMLGKHQCFIVSRIITAHWYTQVSKYSALAIRLKYKPFNAKIEKYY